jgi:hypothetical protein
VPVAGSEQIGHASGAAAPFPSQSPSVAEARPVASPPPSAALEAVRRGELDVHGYIEAKVSDATAHLSQLSPAQLEQVKRVVRAQLLSDPTVADLVEQATGARPPAEEG